MRKLFAIILGAAMMLSLLVVGVSAADPVAVKTAEEFANMSADGNYYLDADLELSASYGTFKGTFDGKGHKVTLSGKPMFSTLDGATVSDLVLEGSVSVSGNAGALAGNCNTNGCTITKVTNKANVTTTKSKGYAGGLFGQMSTPSGSTYDTRITTKITDCVNEGKISGNDNAVRIAGLVGNAAKYHQVVYTRCINKGEVAAETGVSGSPYVAGIAGSAFGAEFYDCINEGKITSAAGSHMGGILGRMSPSPQSGDQSVIISGCKNTGTLNSTSGTAGGIVGYVGNPANTDNPPKPELNVTQVLKLTKCVNEGDITSGGSHAGGLVGYVYGVDKVDSSGAARTYYSHAELYDCVNKGKITGTYSYDAKAAWQADATKNPGSQEATYVSQFIAYTNTPDTVIQNCIGAGTVSNVNEDYNVIFGLSSAVAMNYNVSGNKITEGTKNYSWATDEFAKDGSNYTSEFTKNDDGTVKGDRTFNRIALTADLADKVKVLTSAEMDVLLNGGGTTDPGTTTPVVTGDTAVIVMIVCLVSLLGMGIALKARRA